MRAHSHCAHDREAVPVRCTDVVERTPACRLLTSHRAYLVFEVKTGEGGQREGESSAHGSWCFGK